MTTGSSPEPTASPWPGTEVNTTCPQGGFAWALRQAFDDQAAKSPATTAVALYIWIRTHQRLGALETELDRRFCQINGAGILLHSILSLTSPAERHDGGFFLACLCTPLLGPDLAQHLPRYRPTSLLARQTNGDLEQLLPRWHHRLALAHTPEQRRHLCRTIARRLVRTGFTLIMPTWKGWTSDLDESAHLFATHHPERAEQMYTAAHLAHHPSHEPADLNLLLHDLAPWLAHTYTATHGTKT